MTSEKAPHAPTNDTFYDAKGKVSCMGWCRGELLRYIRSRGYDTGPDTAIKKLGPRLIEVTAVHLKTGDRRKRWVQSTGSDADGSLSWQWHLTDPRTK